MRYERKARLWVAAALAAGALLRAWFILRVGHVTGDGLVYGDIARNLLAHGVYGFTAEGAVPRPTLIRLPGYPLFLALCFRLFGVGNYTAVLLVQAVVDLGGCCLIAASARRIFGGRAGLAALWLAALCPFTANYVAAPLTETLTLAVIALAFWALLRWQGAGEGMNHWLAVLGAALAYAVLLRPEQALLTAAIVPAMLWRRAWLPAMLVCLLTVAPLVPWTARNWHTFHVVQPLAPRFATDPGEFNPAGFQRWYRTWAVDFASTDEVYWSYDGAPIDVANLPARAFDSPAQHAQTEALLARYNETTSATPELDREFAALARTRTAAHPWRTHVGLPVARLGNMLFRPRLDMLSTPLRWWRFYEHPVSTLFAAGYGMLSLGYFALAGWTLAHRRWWRGHAVVVSAMVVTLALRAAVLLTLDNSEPRYTLEFFPVLIVLGATAAVRTERRSRQA